MIWFSSSLYGQNKMVNGGFEDYSIPSPIPAYPHLIDYAPGWHSLSLSPDLLHPSTANGAGNGTYLPRTGQGHGHFWSSDFDGVSIESMYGTTDSLAAGQTYTVSFYIMNSSGNPYNFEVQAYMSHTVPNPSSTDPFVWSIAPQLTCVPTGSYEKYTFCYTAVQGGNHYLSIGSFNLSSVPNRQSKVDFNIDDVSVTAINSNDPNTSLITVNSEFCVGNTVLADGSGSTGELEHKWEVYRLSGNSEILISSGSIQPGAAGTFDVTSAFTSAGHTPSAGNCYRVYLTTYSNCPVKSHADFCYVNVPAFNFVHDGTPACENDVLNLQVTGDDGWTYEWSSGQSGVGMKSVFVTPTAPSASYTVTVTSQIGCTFSRTLNLMVHSSVGQVAPTMNGINGTYDYTIYTNAGLPLEFSSFIFNNAGEIVSWTQQNNLPSGHLLVMPPENSNGGTVTFKWTPMVNATGDYYFTLYLKDNNGCNELENTYTFRIVVICEYCNICISYNDRTPSSNPMPLETNAAQCIVAGTTGTVIPVDGTIFRAGQYIILDSLFDSQDAEFEAVIDPSTCVTDCEDCCIDFAGFTYDFIPNVIIPQHSTYNVWHITDSQHPDCAYNATSFELYVLNRWGTLVYKKIEFGGICCGFHSYNGSEYSSISWDGTTNVGFNQGEYVELGEYYFVLYLHGCGMTATLDGKIRVVSPNSNMQLTGDEATGEYDPNVMLSIYGDEELIRQGILPDGLPEDRFFVFPNPTDGLVHIHGGKPMKQVQVLDMNGKVLFERSGNLNQPVDLSSYSAGKYLIRVTFNDNTTKKMIVVRQ